MNCTEVAAMLGVSGETVNRWCKWDEKPLPHKKKRGKGDLYNIEVDQLTEWLRHSWHARKQCNPLVITQLLGNARERQLKLHWAYQKRFHLLLQTIGWQEEKIQTLRQQLEKSHHAQH